jgi:hypothetical protein
MKRSTVSYILEEKNLSVFIVKVSKFTRFFNIKDKESSVTKTNL